MSQIIERRTEPAPIRARGGWFAVVAIVLVAIDLRPAIVLIGPILATIREQ
jgi:cyanate permease